MLVHPDGPAEKNDTYWVSAGQGSQFEKIAEATGGALGFRVQARAQLNDTLARALATVRAGRSAVVSVQLAPVTAQVLRD
jgi:acetolactate synthase-1/2/3 large subunit